RAMFAAREQFSATQRQLAEAQAELDRRRRELTVFSSRIEQVFQGANLLPQSEILSEQLRQLRSVLVDQEAGQKRRRSLLRRQRNCRLRQRSVVGRLRRLRSRRKKLLHECGTVNLAEFRRRSAEFSQIA